MVDEYDAARPAYPAALYAALDSAAGGLSGKVVVDIGAGTGIATRQLGAHGAWVIACEPSLKLLQRAGRAMPGLVAVAGRGEALPLAATSADLACFAQSWHWIDQEKGAAEAARVLRTRGLWAAWWSHPWADDEAWFSDYQDLIEGRCSGYSRKQRDVDWGSTAIGGSASFEGLERVTVPWERTATVGEWLTELRSHSYVAGLDGEVRTRLVADVGDLLATHFPDGTMAVAYETRLWLARRV